MDNQHRKIATYRELNESEIALMNRIKAKEAELAELVALVRVTVPVGEPRRQVALAVTAFEEGCMRLVRAVAQPASPWDARLPVIEPISPKEPAA